VPPGFREAARKGLVSDELSRSINTLCSIIIDVSERTRSTPGQGPILSDQRCSMIHSLIDLLQDPSRIASENIEECCVLAILIYDLIILSGMRPTAGPQITLSRDLKSPLEQTNLSLYWNGEFNLLLWVLSLDMWLVICSHRSPGSLVSSAAFLS
jgi:hypothetical protein